MSTQQEFRNFYFDVLSHTEKKLQAVCDKYGLSMRADFSTLGDRKVFDDYIDNAEYEEDGILVINYLDSIPNTGFWFGWQLLFGTIHIALPGNYHVFLPLSPQTALTPIQHSDYIVQSLIMLLNGDVFVKVFSNEHGPIGLQLVHKATSEIIFQSKGLPDVGASQKYTFKTYANRLDISSPTQQSLLQNIHDADNHEMQDGYVADGLIDFSWWGHDVEYDEGSDNDNSTSHKLASPWWLLVLAVMVEVLIIWVMVRTGHVSWLGGDWWLFYQIILPAVISIFLGLHIAENYPGIVKILRVVERFTFTPLNKFLAATGRFLYPLASSKWRLTTLIFLLTQAALSLQYFYDNAVERTTNRVLPFSEMATLHPIVWAFPLLQVLATLGYFTKRFVLLYISSIAYVAIQIWASFGGIYFADDTTIIELHGWQAAADWLVGIAAIITIGVAGYGIYRVFASPLGFIARKTPRRTRNRVIKSLERPNILSPSDHKQLDASQR